MLLGSGKLRFLNENEFINESFDAVLICPEEYCQHPNRKNITLMCLINILVL